MHFDRQAMLGTLMSSNRTRLRKFSQLRFNSAGIATLPSSFNGTRLPYLRPGSHRVRRHFRVSQELTMAVHGLVARLIGVNFHADAHRLTMNFRSRFIKVSMTSKGKHFSQRVSNSDGQFHAFQFLMLLSNLKRRTRVRVRAGALSVPTLLITRRVTNTARLGVLRHRIGA